MLRFVLHYGIHFLVPIAIGLLFYKENRSAVILILLSAIFIDLDHLFADPVFDPNRCSIGFHPFHSYAAVGIYLLLFIIPKSRVFGLGLLIHMLADSVDCLFIR